MFIISARCSEVLGTCFGTNDEEKSGIHDSSTVQHRGHEDIGSRVIDKGDITDELHAMTTTGPLTEQIIFFFIRSR